MILALDDATALYTAYFVRSAVRVCSARSRAVRDGWFNGSVGTIEIPDACRIVVRYFVVSTAATLHRVPSEPGNTCKHAVGARFRR